MIPLIGLNEANPALKGRSGEHSVSKLLSGLKNIDAKGESGVLDKHTLAAASAIVKLTK